MKCTSLLIAALAAAITTSACSATKVGAPPTTDSAPDAQSEGGVNGGGGGTLPAQPIGAYRVHDIIREAKRSLAPMVKFNQRIYDPTNATALDKKLYGSKPNLYDVLYSTNIEVPDDKPCFDSAGNPVDGSMYASEPDAICISAFRIAPKLIEERAQTEIFALILHELSHKLGADEAEAVELQQFTANSLDNRWAKKSIDQFLTDVRDSTEDLSHKFYGIDFAKQTRNELSKELTQLNVPQEQVSSLSWSLPFSLFNFEEGQFQSVEQERLVVLQLFVDSDTSPASKTELDNIFKGASSVTYFEYMTHLGISNFKNIYGNELIQRPKDLHEAGLIFYDIQRFYSAVADTARSIDFGTRPNPIELPTQDHSVDAFVGTYQVLSVKCSDPSKLKDADETKFEFQPSVIGPMLTKSGSWYTSGEGGFYTGATVSGASAVSVDAGPDWISRTSEFGDRWGSRQALSYSSRTLKFVNNGSGSYTLIRTDYSRKENIRANTFDHNSTDCVYALHRL